MLLVKLFFIFIILFHSLLYNFILSVTFYVAFLGKDLAPMAGTLPAMFAKSAFVWSSLIYIYSNRQVREKTFAWLGYRQEVEETKKVDLSPSRSKYLFFILMEQFSF